MTKFNLFSYNFFLVQNMLEIDLNSGGEVEVGGDESIHIQTMTGEHGLMSNKETLQDFMSTIDKNHWMKKN